VNIGFRTDLLFQKRQLLDDMIPSLKGFNESYDMRTVEQQRKRGTRQWRCFTVVTKTVFASNVLRPASMSTKKRVTSDDDTGASGCSTMAAMRTTSVFIEEARMNNLIS
jgi:hypothetical protein